VGGVVGGVTGSCAAEGVESLSSFTIERGGGGISSVAVSPGESDEDVGVRFDKPEFGALCNPWLRVDTGLDGGWDVPCP
jgi:hypothetical protein